MIHQAIIYAAHAHENQFRKGTKLPYIIHPLEVAQILSRAGTSDIAIVTGILHDVLEDTSASSNELKKNFGIQIAEYVQQCTNTAIGPWRFRKETTLNKLEKSDDANLVSVLSADKLSNLRSILFDYTMVGDALWARFSAPKEDVVWYYRMLEKIITSHKKVPSILKEEYDSLFYKLNTHLL